MYISSLCHSVAKFSSHPSGRMANLGGQHDKAQDVWNSSWK